MQDTLRAVLLCTNSLWREAIAAALRFQNIEVVDHDERGGIVATNDKVHVGLIAADDNAARMLAEYDPLMIDNWLVIGSVANQSVIKKLISTGRRVSVASPKLGGRQLAHVASLAALGQPTCATDDCASCRPRDANKLDEAALDEDHWLLMRCLAEGLSNKEIARLQTTSEGAVKARVRALLSRLGVTNRTQAAVIGARAGLRLERTAPKQQLVFDTPPERARTFFALVS